MRARAPTRLLTLPALSLPRASPDFLGAVEIPWSELLERDESKTHHKLLRRERLSEAARAIGSMLRWFASTQIRNVACLGGNIATASPISDMIPMLVACRAVAQVASAARGVRDAPLERCYEPGVGAAREVPDQRRYEQACREARARARPGEPGIDHCKGKQAWGSLTATASGPLQELVSATTEMAAAEA